MNANTRQRGKRQGGNREYKYKAQRQRVIQIQGLMYEIDIRERFIHE
jgi:hypothetical protein